MCPVNVSSLTRRSVPTLLKPGTDSGFVLSSCSWTEVFFFNIIHEESFISEPAPRRIIAPTVVLLTLCCSLKKKDSCFIKYISQLASLICRIVGVSCAHLLHVYFTRVSLTRPRLEGGCAKKRLLGLASKIYTSL